MAPAGYGNRVEGLHAVDAAARAGRIVTLWVEPGRLRHPEVQEIADRVGSGRVRTIPDARSIAETGEPQGLVAECSPIAPVVLDGLAGEGAALVVLDHIEDPQNVGAIARTALASGMTGMVISSRRAAPLSAAAFKAASGALESVPVAVVTSIPDALRRLSGLGVWGVGLDASADQSLFGLEILTEPVALVVGAEGRGLSELTAKRCDLVVSIPMTDMTESLNASVSAALACFETMRARIEAHTAPEDG
jgi:23S rRNA (guanosine2251-2'-O)-methyltransferase